MRITESLSNRLREVILDGKWIANTNFIEQLSRISYITATQKIGGLNTIAQLTFHINYFIEGVIPVFLGQSLEIRDKYSFDMPLINSEGAWKSMVNDLAMNTQKLAALIDSMDEAKLDEPFFDPKYGSYLRNIEGIIEHSYYHLGQISMLSKLIDIDS